jgi:hypothetical protein
MKRIIATLAAMAMLVLATAAPTLAQQTGLVNVEIGDVTVAVPVAVAANICGVSVNVIATDFVGTQDVVCEADADAIALVPEPFLP